MAEGWIYSLQFQGEIFALEDGELTAGRSRTCHVTISDASVSRRHVILVPGPGHVVVRDLGSSNGTFINERRVQAEDVVEHGDVLRMGDAEIQVTIENPEHFQTARLPPQGASLHDQLPQPGEATFFLQAESMKLAETMESSAGPSAAEFKMPSAEPEMPSAEPAMPSPPQPADVPSPSAMPIPPSAMPIPPSVLPVPPSSVSADPTARPAVSLDTQRLDVQSLGFGPPAAGPPAAGPPAAGPPAAGPPAAGPPPVTPEEFASPAVTQRLPSLEHLASGSGLASPAFDGRSVSQSPASPAETQRFEAPAFTAPSPEARPVETPSFEAPSFSAPGGDSSGAEVSAQTQRFEVTPQVEPPPSLATPPSLTTQRFEAPPLAEPIPSSMQTTAMTPEQLAALRTDAELTPPLPSANTPLPVSPEFPSSSMKTTAMTPQQIETLRAEALSPSPPQEAVPVLETPSAPEIPSASMQTTAMTAEQLDALRAEAMASVTPPESPVPPAKPTTAEELMAMPVRAKAKVEPAASPPQVQPYSLDGADGAVSIEIPSVPDIDVASEQSILGMPMVSLTPEADVEMPSVPDIDISSEQSIIGMAVAPLEPEHHVEAPIVPEIAIDDPEDVAPMVPAAELRLPSLGAPRLESLPADPPVPEAPSFDAPASGPSFDAPPSFDAAPAFGEPSSFDAPPTFDAQPSFDAPSSLDASPGVDSSPAFDAPPSFDAPPAFDASPTFDASPSFDAPPSVDSSPSIDAAPAFEAPPSFDAPPAFDAPPTFGSGATVRPEPSGPGLDALSFGDLDASSEFQVKLQGEGSVPPAMVLPPEPEPELKPKPEPPSPVAAKVDPVPFEAPDSDFFAPPAIETFDAPLPEITADPGSGAFSAPERELFTPETPEASDLAFSELPSDPAAAASFDQVTPPAAGSFAQPTPAAMSPPVQQQVLERSPVADLLPSLDDITSSVGPPEMRPPQQPTVETDAFPMLPSQPTAHLPTSDSLVPAGPGIRLMAYLIDGILFAGLGFAGKVALSSIPMAPFVLSFLGPVVLLVGWSLAGTSPGKWACRLVIRDADGNARLGPATAILRLFGYLLSTIPFGLGFLLVPLSKDRRGVQDRLAGTMVYRA